MPGQFGDLNANEPTGPQTGDRSMTAVLAAATAFTPNPQTFAQIDPLALQLATATAQTPAPSDLPLISEGLPQPQPQLPSTAVIQRLTSAFGVMTSVPEAFDRQRPPSDSRRIMYGDGGEVEEQRVGPDDGRLMRSLSPSDAAQRMNGGSLDVSSE